MVGRHHRLNEHEFEQAPGDGEGQGSLACCGPRDRGESDTTEWTEHHHHHRSVPEEGPWFTISSTLWELGGFPCGASDTNLLDNAGDARDVG